MVPNNYLGKFHFANFLPTVADRSDRLYKEKCAIERMCEDKQQVTNITFRLCISMKHLLSLFFPFNVLVQLILSLEKRLMEVNGTLQKVRDGFLEKSADLEALQRKADDQVRR